MTRHDPHPTLTSALSLQAEIAARADEMDEVRRLPADLARKMAQAGLFRIVTPSAYGGLECSPAQIVDAVAAVAEANASAGWCMMIGATTAINAAYMDRKTAELIYGDPLTITGGVFAPMGRAIVDGDDYVVSGQWQWGSGSANCSWLCGGAMIVEKDGEIRRLPSGRPDTRMMVFRAEDAELIDTWHVMGLKGTGSGDIAVKDLRIPQAQSVSLVTDTPKVGGALYAFPVFGLLSLGVAATALGNARGALNSFKLLATVKKSQGSSKSLSERATIQTDFAKSTAALNSAQAYLYDEIEKTWDMAETTGEIEVSRRTQLRLACTHMVRTSADVCRTTYELGGGAALYLQNDLQRRFRDSHAMTQHIVAAPATYELFGRILFDLPTDVSMV